MALLVEITNQRLWCRDEQSHAAIGESQLQRVEVSMLRTAGLISALLASGAAFHPQPGRTEETGSADNVVLARYQTYCSSDQPGVSIAELQWPIAVQGLTALDVKAAVDRQVLEVTVYKDGFNRGLYKSVQPGRLEARFDFAKPEQAKPIPGLANLRLTSIGTSAEEAKPGLRMLSAPIPGRESMIAKVEGLEGGMRYFWRIAPPGETQQNVALTAAICPVDWIEPPGGGPGGPTRPR
jgi:hypothetical protein